MKVIEKVETKRTKSKKKRAVEFIAEGQNLRRAQQSRTSYY
jgi:hypothetical protein